ncbi:MAG: alpha/beta hydrolase, partial [Bacteroidota bacterium]
MKKVLLITLAIIGLATAALAVFLFGPNRIVSKQEVKAKLSLPSSHFINWKGGEIHYTDTGSGQVVLMIHGYASSLRHFDSLAVIMSKHYRVVRVDLPGFGMSDFPEIKGGGKEVAAMFREFMPFFIDQLHTDSLYLIGNSLGGWISWELADTDTARVKKVVLLASAGYEMDHIIADLMPPSSADFIRLMSHRGFPLKLSEGGVDRCMADPTKVPHQTLVDANVFMNREGNMAALLKMVEDVAPADTTKILHVPCPVLVIWGKQDQIIPVAHAEKFRRDLQKGRIILYDQCGHFPQIE